MARCRVCPAEIIWAVNQHTGRPIPLDKLATPDGNVHVTFLGSPPRAHVMTLFERNKRIEEVRGLGMPTPMFYVEHHATCSGAKRVDAGELVGQASLF